jgi:hypothetical protein
MLNLKFKRQALKLVFRYISSITIKEIWLYIQTYIE